MSPLKPLPSPIAIFDQFVYNEPQTIVLREKVLSVSGDSFDIKFANGDNFLTVSGSWATFSGRKKVYDAQNKHHLFDIVKEHFRLHETYAIENTHRKTIAEVKSNLSCKYYIILLPWVTAL